MTRKSKTPTPVTITLWSLIIIGLATLQFPGILFYHDVTEPRILGMPFIYGFNMVVWAVLCAVLLVAYRVRWGRPRPEELDEQDSPGADEEGSKP
ncbi:hypothetical protein [Nocardiopsis nanhaiensis]